MTVRVIDGYDAAEFIQRVKGLLEHPAMLFINRVMRSGIFIFVVAALLSTSRGSAQIFKVYPFITKPVVVEAVVQKVWSDKPVPKRYTSSADIVDVHARLKPVSVLEGKLTRPLPVYTWTANRCEGGFVLDCIDDEGVSRGEHIIALIESDPAEADSFITSNKPDMPPSRDRAELIVVEPLVSGAELKALIAEYQPQRSKRRRP